MNSKESKNLGGRQALKATAVLFLLYELFLLYNQTKGDFANGILFFMSNQANGYFLLFILLSFTFMFLSGRQAGYLVLVKSQNKYLVAIAGAFITTLLIIIFFLITTTVLNHDRTKNNITGVIEEELPRMFFVLIVPMALAWFWITSRLHTKFNNE